MEPRNRFRRASGARHAEAAGKDRGKEESKSVDGIQEKVSAEIGTKIHAKAETEMIDSMAAELYILRLVHILGGIFWLGSGLFTTFFLMPALGRIGPAAAGPLMGALQQRRLFTVLPIVAVLTILSGVRLFQIVSAGFAPAYLASPTGKTFLWSGIAAIAAFLLSLLVARPAALRAGQLAGSIPSLPEDQRAGRAAEAERLRRRSALAGIIAMVLLVGAAAGMAVARYVH